MLLGLACFFDLNKVYLPTYLPDLTKLLVHASINDYNSSSEKHMFWHPIILTQQMSPVGWSHYKSSLTGGRWPELPPHLSNTDGDLTLVSA